MKLRPNIDMIGELLATRLSPTQLKVFGGVACGWSPANIGAMLDMSPKTVGTHTSRIVEKLGLCNTHEITVFAMLNGLLHIEGTPYKVVRVESPHAQCNYKEKT